MTTSLSLLLHLTYFSLSPLSRGPHHLPTSAFLPGFPPLLPHYQYPLVFHLSKQGPTSLPAWMTVGDPPRCCRRCPPPRSSRRRLRWGWLSWAAPPPTRKLLTWLLLHPACAPRVTRDSLPVSCMTWWSSTPCSPPQQAALVAPEGLTVDWDLEIIMMIRWWCIINTTIIRVIKGQQRQWRQGSRQCRRFMVAEEAVVVVEMGWAREISWDWGHFPTKISSTWQG